MTCPEMPALGVYVLGAVDDEEQARVEAHLDHCAECAHELERLMPLPHHLALLSAGEVASLDEAARPPAGMLTRLHATQAVSRTRLRRQRVAALAAAAAFALAAGVLATGRDAGAPPPVTSAAAADRGTGVRAQVDLAARPSGSALTLRMRGAAPGQQCRLVVLGRDGRSDVAATWTATYTGTADIAGTTAIPKADVAAIDVVTSAGRRLVHVPVPNQENPS
jgi:hypothetical protein